MLLLKILILSPMIILYIFTLWKKTLLVVIVGKLSVQKNIKIHINDRFKINDKQMIQMPREGDYVTVKNYE